MRGQKLFICLEDEWVWNDVRVSKWWPNIILGWTIHLKWLPEVSQRTCPSHPRWSICAGVRSSEEDNVFRRGTSPEVWPSPRLYTDTFSALTLSQRSWGKPPSLLCTQNHNKCQISLSKKDPDAIHPGFKTHGNVKCERGSQRAFLISIKVHLSCSV